VGRFAELGPIVYRVRLNERRRVLRLLDEMAWAASISPQPAGRVVEERLQTLRERINRL